MQHTWEDKKTNLGWKPGGKRLLRRPRHRWQDNIKMDLEELGGC
jgi:hypothetical protein